MSGTPGTARFGVNPDATPDHTNSAGISHMTLPKSGGTFTETHFLYNPVQRSRGMGSTEGTAPGQMWMPIEHQANYMCNHDGYMAGNNVVANLDERKVLTNTIYSIGCEYTDESPNGRAPSGTKGKFD